MLDSAHRFALKAVESGDHDATPAVRNLLELGLVERVDGTELRVTQTGETALRLSAKSRTERWALYAGAGATVVLALILVLEQLAG